MRAFDFANGIVLTIIKRVNHLPFSAPIDGDIGFRHDGQPVPDILDLMPCQRIAGAIGDEKLLRCVQGLADADGPVEQGGVNYRLQGRCDQSSPDLFAETTANESSSDIIAAPAASFSHASFV